MCHQKGCISKQNSLFYSCLPCLVYPDRKESFSDFLLLWLLMVELSSSSSEDFGFFLLPIDFFKWRGDNRDGLRDRALWYLECRRDLCEWVIESVGKTLMTDGTWNEGRSLKATTTRWFHPISNLQNSSCELFH